MAAVSGADRTQPTDRATLGPVAVRRRCRVPGTVLADLGSDLVWQAAGAWAAAEDTVRDLGARLADHLGAQVPTAPPEQRRDLLRARRAAFNARPLPDRPVPGGEPVASYTRMVAARDSARRELDLALGKLARTAGAAVDTVLTDPDIAWSVELSVPGLLAAGPLGVLDPAAGRRTRRRAMTLLRLVQRAATKPTPFAGFATTHLLFRDGPATVPRRHVRVQRAVVEWTRRWIAADGHRILRPEHLWLTANPSALVREDAEGPRVTWLASGPDGAERVLSARCNPALADTLRRLRTPVRLDTVAPDGTLPAALTTLAARGLLELGPVLPTHGRRVLHTAAEATRPAPGAGAETAQDVHDTLCDLRDAEDDLAVARHADALHRARRGVARLARTLQAAGQDAGRAAVGEDVVGVATDDGILRTSPDVLADLGRVQRIVPLLGAELPFQLATAIAFRRRFGADPVPLPAAYQWFLEAGRKESDALLTDCTADELAAVLHLRERLFTGLRAAADRSGTEVSCDPDLLDAVAARLPDAVLDLPCAAWPVQVAGERLVLNGVGSGHGRFAARVAADLDDTRTAELRTWASTAHTPHRDGIPVDISALLGATVNEHPLLLPAALACPGRALECPPENRIDLSACTVRAQDGRLLLFSDRFPGRPLFPVPHNATLPTVAPGLYRWLSRLGPATGATLDLWDHVDARTAPHDPAAVRHYPRLTLGRLVLSRRTWKVSGAALPDPAPADPAEETLAWYRWCARTGVPRRSFLRTTTLPDPWDVVRGRADKRPVLAARSTSGAAIRKPLYVDLSQPLCRPAVTAAPGDTLTFTEPLPDPVGPGPDGRVTEYVLEISQPPRA
ncbi:lantibiotic dehydratase family protein [Streptomyces sp. S1A]|uniref:lantibiotic dehydratase n=1 Tax=Streptomyces sp. ICN903 TaxID=2964654 RepID=UPI001EDC249A|nr:lantibiotic dehydratase [Streptomyces sp. ICN903]MCG3039534.1 lantibiotic dehydratase family protein [Streptomyces sp. ICN903]